MKNQDHNSTSKVVPGVDDLQLLAANSSVDAAEAVSESSNPTKPSPDQEYSATLEDFADIKSSDATNATKKQRKNRRIWTHQVRTRFLSAFYYLRSLTFSTRCISMFTTSPTIRRMQFYSKLSRIILFRTKSLVIGPILLPN